MNATCGGCNRGAPFDGPYDASQQCRLCWLYHNDPGYRKLWGGESVEMPSLFQQAINYTKAVAKHVATGAKEAGPGIVAARLALCQACEFHTSDNRCSKCGCWTKSKASWQEQSCPIGKW